MKINILKKEMTIRDFLKQLGSINLKPQYQREFVYNAEQSSKVIDSILLGLPLNILYLNENEGGSFLYEVIDGQQRLKSIVNFYLYSHSLIKMSYVDWNEKVWEGLSDELKKRILDYKLEFYIITKDNDSNTKLDIFRRINTVGEKLNNMELLNATYPGVFIDEIKRFCHDNENRLRDLTGKGYLRGDTEEIILRWFGENPALFLSIHQRTSFNESDFPKTVIKVINWFDEIVESKNKNKIYQNKDCLRLYEHYELKQVDYKNLKKRIDEYLANIEIQNRYGILEFALQEVSGENTNEQLLNLRAFPPEWKSEFFSSQDNRCAKCGKTLEDSREYNLAELDHIKSWKNGGLTTKENCQLLCQSCNRRKSSS